MILDKEFDEIVMVCAFRYALGRHSYMPGLIMKKLDEVWDQISKDRQNLILDEIDQYIRDVVMIHGLSIMDDLDVWVQWREKKLSGK